MADISTDTKKAVAKGGRKGGAIFPRFSLKDALGWSKKLVSKSHVEPQPIEVVYAGVVGSKGSRGRAKISALKQFGLLEGPSTAYTSTLLAKQIESAPEDERVPLFQSAALHSSIFKSIFDTFQSDEVSEQKLRQRAYDLRVHPEEAEACVTSYVASLGVAGLVSKQGDKIIHRPISDVKAAIQDHEGDEDDVPDEDAAADQPGNDEGREEEKQSAELATRSTAIRANVAVSISVDATLDTEKLERQLKLLKQYGVI
jgi:hypothetical protein